VYTAFEGGEIKMNKANRILKNQVQELTKKELVNAKANIKKYLEGALLSLLGLEKRYSNEYEIDHCNGRNSVLIDSFRELAISEARKIASEYKPSKEDLSVYKVAFERELKNQFSYCIRDIAKAKAVELARDVMATVKIDVDEILEKEFGEKPKDQSIL
jgi:hypothetical protein